MFRAGVERGGDHPCFRGGRQMKRLLVSGGTGNLGTFVVDRLKREYDCVLLNREDVANPSIDRFKGAAAYIVSKNALNTLIEVTANEIGGSGVTVNALLPGTLDTPAMREEMPKARRVPLDRVADAIIFLLSEGAANINGALIPLRA